MDPSDPDIRAIGPNAVAIAGLGTLPAEVILMIARLADNSRDMLRLAKVNRHCYRHCCSFSCSIMEHGD